MRPCMQPLLCNLLPAIEDERDMVKAVGWLYVFQCYCVVRVTVRCGKMCSALCCRVFAVVSVEWNTS